MADDPENVKSALQMLYELEGRDFSPAQPQAPAPTLNLKPLDENSARYGEAEDVKPSEMSYGDQMKNVWETIKPTPQGSKDAAAIAASGIYGAPMDIAGLLHGAREVIKGRIPEAEEMQLPGGSHYLEQRAKETGKLSQEPSGPAQATGILGSILADPLAAAGKLGTVAAVVPAAAKGANVVEKALPVAQKAQRELSPLGLYSHSAEVASRMKQEDTPEAALSYLLNNGAKKEELLAAGIMDRNSKVTPEFAQMGRVSPADLAEKIKTGFPQVEELVLESPRYEMQTFYEPIFKDRAGNPISLGRYESERAADAAAQEHARLRPGLGDYEIKPFEQRTPVPVEHEVMFGPQQYPQATTPGGENYREILLRTPYDEARPQEVYMMKRVRKKFTWPVCRAINPSSAIKLLLRMKKQKTLLWPKELRFKTYLIKTRHRPVGIRIC